MKKFILPIILGLLLLFIWTNSCKSPSSVDQPLNPFTSKSNSTSSSGALTSASTGFLQVILKDNPIADAQNVFVTINKISVHKACEEPNDCDFIIVYMPAVPEKIDLLLLKNTPTKLFTATLEAGKYNQIRMSVVSGEVVFPSSSLGGNGIPYPLEVPSDEIKVPVQFDITTAGTTNITLDFDAEKSVHIVKKGTNDSYLLRPVIHVEGITTN